ncbi:MAG: hypothetical protein Q8R91_01120 [Candidatus Omnitrophota bacterium]|nr:hypothetical protein [Candidatus Omnitrophota bacterium]
MTLPPDSSLFFLGLAGGIALLPITAYRHVSPVWLKWLLIISGLWVMSRYPLLALFTPPETPRGLWMARYGSLGSLVGFTLPSVFAIDQLVRHPAMSPQRLLRWCAPWLTACGAVILFGDVRLAADSIGRWGMGLGVGVAVVGFVGVCIILMRKIPSPPIRTALLGLAVGSSAVGFNGLLIALGGRSAWSFLSSEMLMLLALWHAYETAAALQRG